MDWKAHWAKPENAKRKSSQHRTSQTHQEAQWSRPSGRVKSVVPSRLASLLPEARPALPPPSTRKGMFGRMVDAAKRFFGRKAS